MSAGGNSRPPVSPLFRTGQVVATPGALRALHLAGVSPMELLARHVVGDWGDLCETDKLANDLAVAIGDRIFSSYVIGDGPTKATVWLITEHDRSVSTALLPRDY